MSIRVIRSCRVPHDAVLERDEDGNIPQITGQRFSDKAVVAPPGALLDYSKMDSAQVEGLLANGTIEQTSAPPSIDEIAAEAVAKPRRKGVRK